MKTNTLATPEPPYRAFLVRCWCDGNPISPNSWRFVVVEIDQEDRHGFGTFEDLISFLQAEIYRDESLDEEVTHTDGQQKDK